MPPPASSATPFAQAPSADKPKPTVEWSAHGHWNGQPGNPGNLQEVTVPKGHSPACGGPTAMQAQTAPR